MALFEGLLGGGGGDPLDLYGDLFTPQQKAALRDRQMTDTLLRLSAGFAKAGQASRLPTGGLLGAIGEAAGGLAGGGDEAVNQQLKAMQVAEQVKKAKADRAMDAMIAPIYQRLLQQEGLLGLPPGTLTKDLVPPAAPGAPTGGPLANNAPPPPAGPQPSTGIGAPEGLPGGATSGAGAEWLPNLPPLRPIPPAPPGGRITPADYGVTNPQGAGLLGPPAQDDPWAQYAGLLGGGTGSQVPFDPTTSDPTAAGSPDLNNIKIEQLSGEAAPVGGAGREARVKFWTDQGAPQHVAEGIADRVRAESGFRSDAMGDQGTSGGLYQHHADRLARLKSFAAQQGTSWTDPNVQDRFAATEVRGGDAIAAKGWPAILNAPDRQTAATLWDKYFERSAAGPGSGGGGFSGRIEQLGSDAAPAGAAPSGKIPGLDISPQGLAALNALTKMAGHGDAFSSLLETYYKSPAYLGEAARTEAEARRGVDLKLGPQIKEAETLAELNAKLQLEPKLQAAIETAKNDPRLAFEEKKATIERYTKELEQLRGAGLEPVEVTVRFPGESTPRKITITKAQLPELASGKGIPALGIPQMTGVNLGQPVFTPGQEAEQKGAAESRVKLVQGYREQADLSADAKTTLQGISAEIGNMVHGPFAPAAQLASSYLRVLDPGFNKQVSSYEDLYSNANELVRKAVRQSDPNPSFIQTQMAMDAMPTPSRSPEGLAKITNRMIGVNDHNIARAAAVPYYQANVGNGSVEGFDSWWRKSVSPYAFVFSKMSPDDQAALVSRLNATGQGKREVEKLKTQLGFIKQYGLEQ